ncbi:MAG: hypothetical protein Fues2KO_51680 [Fuerstiella sp.]
MDVNGDGRIDQSEIDRMPEGFRNFMESRGIQLKAGLSVEEFRNNMRSQFSRMREREGGYERPTPESAAPRVSTSNRAEYKPVEPYRPREKERMTVDLPPQYSELDTDFDGQIGLYEWIVARRDDLELFDTIDYDADGLLTPRELLEHDTAAADAGGQLTALVEKYKRPRMVIVGGPNATSGKGAVQTKHLSDDVRQKHESFAAERAFPYIDTNKDGRVSLEELKRDDKTRRVIGMFEKANIKVEPMSREQFTARYIQAMDYFAGQKSGGSERSESGRGDESRSRDRRGRR